MTKQTPILIIQKSITQFWLRLLKQGFHIWVYYVKLYNILDPHKWFESGIQCQDHNIVSFQSIR
jgi:hypothetical protein